MSTEKRRPIGPDTLNFFYLSELYGAVAIFALGIWLDEGVASRTEEFSRNIGLPIDSVYLILESHSIPSEFLPFSIFLISFLAGSYYFTKALVEQKRIY